MSHMPVISNKFGEITQFQKSDGIDILNIQHSLCSASVSLYGGQVLNWQPKGQPPVFWLSDTSHYQQGKAIRGGIPLCWPWFGAYNDAGNHGFARQMQWEMFEANITEHQVELILVVSGQNLSGPAKNSFSLNTGLFKTRN